MLLDLERVPVAPGHADAHHLREQLGLGVGTSVHGLGERLGPLVKNGQVVDMWNAEPSGTPDPLPTPALKGAWVVKSPQRAAKPRTTQRGRSGPRFPRTHFALARVEMAGIEPASNGAEPGLLRVQFAVIFSAPAITRTSRRRAQSLLDFPLHPVTGIKV